jgi:TldD protein
MSFSKYLLGSVAKAKALVDELSKTFKYVSVLGADVKGVRIVANKKSSQIGDNNFDKQQGFVVKMTNGKAFFEYSFNEFEDDIVSFSQKIVSKLDLSNELKNIEINSLDINEEELTKDFVRESDFDKFTNEQLLNFAKKTTKEVLARDEHFLNAFTSIVTQDVSKLFVSKKRCLTQNYTWANGNILGVYNNNGKTIQTRVGSFSNELQFILNELPNKIEELLDKAMHLSLSKPIEPGVYDIITDPTITGLIAHEAFGHGVEMDQFVKDRALAKQMVGKYVASPICNMRDGASGILSTASYFFDDDGVLAQNTQIIKNGKLVSGICDLVSSRQLDFKPTGNGRRESFSHKAYTRMTNTYFEAGKDKLADMIASIDHGYMLFETNNGMEDPKNWAIQCVCEYGIEIKDGKLTDNWVSPVVMSGFVPDLLKSISMISDEFIEEGAGSCGKGYKEWVRVSDGGPHLKAKVKLS